MGKIRLNDKMAAVVVALAKHEQLNEAVALELCEEHKLNHFEENVIMSMYHEAMNVRYERVIVKELKKMPAKNEYTIGSYGYKHSFG